MTSDPSRPAAPTDPDPEPVGDLSWPGVLWSLVLDGPDRGQAAPLPAPDGSLAPPPGAPVWIHIDRNWAQAETFMERHLGLPASARRDLMAPESRPDCWVGGGGVLLNLRGVNLNPGAEPEDMVSLRMWVTESLLVTTRARPIMAAKDIRQRVEESLSDVSDPTGTRTVGWAPGAVAALLAQALADRMQPFLMELDDAIYAIDERDEELREDRPEVEEELEEALHQRRIDIVGLRRYLSPQTMALSRLLTHDHPALKPWDRETFASVQATFIRYVEDLDSLREQAQLLRDRIQQRVQERSNRAMYKLTLMAGVFLPLTFITGLLGVNVAGIPGADTPDAFWILTGLLAVLAIGEWIYIRTSRRF